MVELVTRERGSIVQRLCFLHHDLSECAPSASTCTIAGCTDSMNVRSCPLRNFSPLAGMHPSVVTGSGQVSTSDSAYSSDPSKPDWSDSSAEPNTSSSSDKDTSPRVSEGSFSGSTYRVAPSVIASSDSRSWSPSLPSVHDHGARRCCALCGQCLDGAYQGVGLHHKRFQLRRSTYPNLHFLLQPVSQPACAGSLVRPTAYVGPRSRCGIHGADVAGLHMVLNMVHICGAGFS